MPTQKIPKRISTAVIQSLGAGVVPRIGLEYVAVGRKDEVTALLDDLDKIVAEGGATFRLILGRYGSGKTFLNQLIRGYALQRNFVVADADLSPTRRLTGTDGQGRGLYRELLTNLATKTRPDGGAFPVLLERWISDVQQEVLTSSGLIASDPTFPKAVEQQIFKTANSMQGMVHGFDFATVISAYWNGHQNGNDVQKEAALRWLRGEYSTKTEAREALGVRVIIDDDSWYEYIKLLAHFVKDIGYTGLVIFIDEAVNLYKIANTVSRNNNYERLLTIFNDILQGKAQYLGVLVGGTPQMVEDRQRGLYSYEALRTRLEESRYAKKSGLRDLSGPMIQLDTLKAEEIFVLLQNLRELHGTHFGYKSKITDSQIQSFMNETLNRLGADQFLTPREVVRDFISILNILQQNPDQSFESVMGTLTPSQQNDDPEVLTPETEIQDEAQPGSPYTKFEI
jgi:hypothetical protein